MPIATKEIRKFLIPPGVPSLVVVVSIILSGWFLIAKVDAEGLPAPVRHRLILLIATALSLILVVSAAMFLLWRRQQRLFYRARLEADLERHALAGQYEYERLRSTLDAFSAVIESSAAAIVSVSPDFVVTTWNTAAELMFGWTADEAIGSLAPFVPASSRELTGRILAEAMHGDVRSGLNGLGQCKDGRLINLSISAAPLHDSVGRCAGVALNFLDLSDRTKAEAALRGSEERFRQVVESAPEGILVERDLCILYVNAASVAMFGAASSAELEGRNLLDLMAVEDRAGVRDRSAQVAGRVALPPLERSCLRLDGVAFPVEVSATPIEYGRQSASLVFMRDISERKQAEAEQRQLEDRLLQSQKMESLGRLAGGVAHDFNNHLTVITGYCDMVLGRLDADDLLREELEEIRAAGVRAGALTQQLLAFSRKQIAERRPVNLNDVVAESDKMLARLAGEQIQIVTDLDLALGLAVADRGQMIQVLMNLVINARDSMPSGGKIRIATAHEDIDPNAAAIHKGAAPGCYVRLSVADTGAGMSAETLPHVFEPFFTTKGIGIGTGLGLSTVYGIVQQSGGWIDVDSAPEKGSRFRIYLPRVAAVVTPTNPREPETEAPAGTETVLLAEDQPEVRRLALRILKSNGYAVLEAGSGPEALEQSRGYGGAIDLLVTDVVMPGMTGRELATRLLESRPHTKVLYVSGYTADVIGKEGVLDSGVAYLPKPFTPAQLSIKVREVLGQSKAEGKILVMDDDAAIRGVIQQTLADAGYEVLEAPDGRAGMRLVAEQEFDVVLTDMIMSGQEGIETIRQLRQGFPGVRIVAISSASDEVYLKTAGFVGVDVTLRKPIDSHVLLRTVRELLS